ncbi:MAG: hypothetical protein IPI03_23715 [Rubrivivax sp.]|nr:hypothetical protein [Rubrivivax sp.]
MAAARAAASTRQIAHQCRQGRVFPSALKAGSRWWNWKQAQRPASAQCQRLFVQRLRLFVQQAVAAGAGALEQTRMFSGVLLPDPRADQRHELAALQAQVQAVQHFLAGSGGPGL